MGFFPLLTNGPALASLLLPTYNPTSHPGPAAAPEDPGPTKGAAHTWPPSNFILLHLQLGTSTFQDHHRPQSLPDPYLHFIFYQGSNISLPLPFLFIISYNHFWRLSHSAVNYIFWSLLSWLCHILYFLVIFLCEGLQPTVHVISFLFF